MEESREYLIERLSSDGKLEELKEIMDSNYTQQEIDIALENALAYSRIETAEYLLSLGANISNYDYQGVYYAVHNNQFKGLKFAIHNGVDVNINGGQLLNTSIITAYNEKDITILKWLIENGADTTLISKTILETFSTPEIMNVIKKPKE